MDLNHKGIVFNGDMKCVVCWSYCGTNSYMNRCKGCLNYNRFNCAGCNFPIKVQINNQSEHLCGYCGGDLERINDIKYQGTTDYMTKYRIRYNFKDKLNVNICSKCYKSDDYESIASKTKCDLCNQYSVGCIEINREYFLSI